MNASVITFEREFWRKLIEGALPSRTLLGDREALIRALVECIAKWLAENPNLGPHAERVRQIATAFDLWLKATERVGTVLREQGIENATGRYQAENEAFIIFARASEGLRRWQRLYKPKEGSEYSNVLLKKLAALCCGPDAEERRHTEERGAGMTEAELETLLQRLTDSGRLPVLLLEIKAFLRGRRDTTTVRSASAAQRTRSR
jgi:hypothetical protein